MPPRPQPDSRSPQRFVLSKDVGYRSLTKKLQKKLAKSLTTSRQELHLLMHDEFFLEALASDQRVATLMRLDVDMGCAIDWLQRDIARPVKREPKATSAESQDRTEVARQLIDRLADAAYRIYGNCDDAIIQHLLAFQLLQLDLPTKTKREKLIRMALDRKVDQFQKRLPNEDYVGADLYGKWNVSRSIDPPWMQA